ncbi:MAG: hypothetical protein EOO02_03845 [Chitinophagaceae bacterium]|nr:MAG: hypothetical protein EOO02_03845 [Chitinophagaceae bacterium]
MKKTLIARDKVEIEGTSTNFVLHLVEAEDSSYYEVEILNELYRLKKDSKDTWTDLEGISDADTERWGALIDAIQSE